MKKGRVGCESSQFAWKGRETVGKPSGFLNWSGPVLNASFHMFWVFRVTRSMECWNPKHSVWETLETAAWGMWCSPAGVPSRVGTLGFSSFILAHDWSNSCISWRAGWQVGVSHKKSQDCICPSFWSLCGYHHSNWAFCARAVNITLKCPRMKVLIFPLSVISLEKKRILGAPLKFIWVFKSMTVLSFWHLIWLSSVILLLILPGLNLFFPL